MTSKVTCSHGYGQLHWLSLWTSLYKSFTEKERLTGKCINYQDLHLFFQIWTALLITHFFDVTLRELEAGTNSTISYLKKRSRFVQVITNLIAWKLSFIFVWLLCLYMFIMWILKQDFFSPKLSPQPGSISPQHPLPYI